MKHYFASGEILYGKSQKELPEGTFKAEYLVYDAVGIDIEYEGIGTIGDCPVLVFFKISEESYPEIYFKNSVRILMQSDLLQADWKTYRIVLLK
ncbi:MAG: hypothetical protein N2489_02160 [Clostridia bacterium]|nr:hypothetical protein [Clostridia bacterium]